MLRPTFLGSFLLLLAAASTPGCATWSKHGVMVSAEQPLRIAVLPVAATADVRNLSEIKSVGAESNVEDADVIQKEVNQAARQLHDHLISELAMQANIVAIPVAPPLTAANHRALWDGGADVVSSVQLPADTHAALLVRLAGYGKLKREWLTYLIGAGVVEGIVQGVIVAQAVSTPWAGVAVAVEEIAQEVLLWGGGARLFGAYYAPVTLEARLISVHDGTIIWTDTVFVSVDKSTIKKLPEPDRERKELQLAATAAKAVHELVSSLRDAVADQIPDTRE